MTVKVSAPGKIHLMGEHAVVYGMPALLTAINLRLSVSIEPAKEMTIAIDDQSARDFVLYALELVKKEYRLSSIQPVSFSLLSDIPFGYHLGSSAALAVATVGAFIYHTKKLWNPQEINRLAYEVEKKQHGNPSGGDNTAVTFGGFLWFRKELEFLKSMWQIPLHIEDDEYQFSLVNTGKPEETTGEMVQFVAEKYKKDPVSMMNFFRENEEQTKHVANALKQQDYKLLIQAIQKGEQTLEHIGVVSNDVVPFLRSVETHGAAAKILGGGGKKHAVGFVLVVHYKKTNIKDIAAQYKYSVQQIMLGEEGVRLESGKHE